MEAGRLRPALPVKRAHRKCVITLRCWQFRAPHHPGRVRKRLAEFRPHLTGAVWRGTATRLNAVHLQLFCDDSKAAELALIDRGISYDVGSTTSPRGAEVDVLSVSSPSPALGEPVTVFLSILDHDDLRGALKPDAGGRSQRGDLAALLQLTTSP